MQTASGGGTIWTLALTLALTRRAMNDSGVGAVILLSTDFQEPKKGPKKSPRSIEICVWNLF